MGAERPPRPCQHPPAGRCFVHTPKVGKLHPSHHGVRQYFRGSNLHVPCPKPGHKPLAKQGPLVILPDQPAILLPSAPGVLVHQHGARGGPRQVLPRGAPCPQTLIQGHAVNACARGRGGGSIVARGAGHSTGRPNVDFRTIVLARPKKTLKSGRRSRDELGREAELGSRQRRKSVRETRAHRPWQSRLGAAGTMRAPSRPAVLHSFA